ncbi:MAG: hypothetical protein IPL49_03735 [Saprospirales bacterium]|nr:hypothetical protein [Saprospirales bacterium]MBK8490026.1 hypothetical protein [Saprospirales bacterium]
MAMPTSQILLSEMEFQRRTGAALDWIRRSIDAHQGNGSAAFYSFGKWAPAYPETTGYLIETLLDYNLLDYALSCGKWLLYVQHPDGSFPSRYADSGQPSIFNTGMILFGLTRLFEDTKDEAYLMAIRRAVDWLLDQLEPDGSWPNHAFVPGFLPSYYTRAVWGVLLANRVLNDPKVEPAMKTAMGYYAQRLQPDGAVRDWGFNPGKPAYTHTIAYSWRGFWEVALLLNEKEWLNAVQKGMERLAALRQQHGKLPGRLDGSWNPDLSFSCLTGNAQLSVLAGRIFQRSGEPCFGDMAYDFFQETACRQVLRPKSSYYGGIAGSHPLWGPYQRLRYPNWAVKFFLDAYLLLFKTNKEISNNSTTQHAKR